MNEAVIQETRRGYSLAIDGRHQRTFDDFDDAVAAFRKISEETEYYPNLYYINERGNIDLLDVRGNTIQSWV